MLFKDVIEGGAYDMRSHVVHLHICDPPLLFSVFPRFSNILCATETVETAALAKRGVVERTPNSPIIHRIEQDSTLLALSRHCFQGSNAHHVTKPRRYVCLDCDCSFFDHQKLTHS